MLIEFNKYQGAGNDFVMIDDRSLNFPDTNNKLIASLCDRRFGIGADGLILIRNHGDLDFEMLYFNSDGEIGTMCGNGGRCAYLFALDKSIVNGEAVFEASDGLHKASVDKDGIISLSMNNVDAPLSIMGNNFLNTGSPHYIIPVTDISKIDVVTRGRAFRMSEQFAPGGTNVNFIEVSNEKIKIRTYERGVEDETLACGTGITAAAISNEWGKEDGLYTTTVEAIGGTLKVNFILNIKGASDIKLIGPAQNVYSGIININKYLT